MTVNALAEHLRVEWRAALRSPSQLMMAWLFPLAFTLVLGAVMPELNPPFREGMVSAFALVALASGTLLGMPGPMVEARATGVLRGFRVLGVPDGAALGVPGLSTGLHALASALLVSLVAALLYGGTAPTQPLGYLAGLALATFAFAGLGSLVGVVARSSRGAMLLSQALFLPSMMLGGMMIPWSLPPERIQPLALWLPSTHAMLLLDGLAWSRPTPLPGSVHAAALAGCALVSWALAWRLFETEDREQKSWWALLLPLALVPLALAGLAGA